MRILVIDDSPGVSEVIELMINSASTKVDWVLNGEEGIEILKDKKNKYDLIFLDWNMPKINGMEFLLRINHTSLVPVLPPVAIISIEASDELLKKVKSLTKVSILGYLLKPFDKNQLDELLLKLPLIK